jgi:hypothetical protein
MSVPVQGKGSSSTHSFTILAVTTRSSMEKLRCWTQWMHDMQRADASTSYSLVVHSHRVANPRVEYAEGTAAKADAILRVASSLAREGPAAAKDATLLLTDLDVVPLRPYRLLLRHLAPVENDRRIDLCFMREPFGSGSGYVNTGFILMRPTEPVLAFLRAWRDNMTSWQGVPSDQLVANRILWGWQAVSHCLSPPHSSHAPLLKGFARLDAIVQTSRFSTSAASTLPPATIWRSSAQLWPELRWCTFPSQVVPGFNPNEVDHQTVAYHAIGSLASKEDMLRAAIQRARQLPRTGETVHVPESSCASTASHAPASRSTRKIYRPRPTGSCSSRRQPWIDNLWPLWTSWNRSDVLGAPPGVPQASAELARRVQASKDGWWGTTDKRVSFRAQGLLRTPWGAGTWGVLPDAPGKLFATFGGADHELSFEAWPAFVSTRCSDGDVVHGIMSRVRV